MNGLKYQLKALRTSKNMTQEELAAALKITRTRLSNFEQGLREPELDLLIAIADYFEVSLDYLVDRDRM